MRLFPMRIWFSAFQDVLEEVAALLGSPSWESGVRLLSWELFSWADLSGACCQVVNWEFSAETHWQPLPPLPTIVETYCRVLSFHIFKLLFESFYISVALMRNAIDHWVQKVIKFVIAWEKVRWQTAKGSGVDYNFSVGHISTFQPRRK